MAYKTLIFGTDDLFAQLQPFYMHEVQRGNLEIVAYAVLEPNGISFVTPDGKRGGGRISSAISAGDNFFGQ